MRNRCTAEGCQKQALCISEGKRRALIRRQHRAESLVSPAQVSLSTTHPPVAGRTTLWCMGTARSIPQVHGSTRASQEAAGVEQPAPACVLGGQLCLHCMRTVRSVYGTRNVRSERTRRQTLFTGAACRRREKRLLAVEAACGGECAPLVKHQAIIWHGTPGREFLFAYCVHALGGNADIHSCYVSIADLLMQVDRACSCMLASPVLVPHGQALHAAPC